MTEKIVVFNDDGSVHSNAIFELMAYACYPEELDAAQGALQMLAREEHRFRKSGLSHYVPDVSARRDIGALSRRITRLYAVGLIVLELVNLGVRSQRMVPAQAIERSLRHRDAQFRMTFSIYDPKTGYYNDKKRSLCRTPKQLGEYFTKYRPVAHLCGALASSSEAAMPFQEQPVLHGRVVTTAIWMQEILRDANKFDEWGLREIEVPDGFDLDRYPPLFIDTDTVTF